jgi:hypothetical protein
MEAAMETTVPVPRHTEWEDLLTMGLGFLIAMSPWIAGEPHTPTIEINAVLIGFVIFGIAAIELTELQRWEEWLNLLAGAWIMAAPWALGYSDHTTLMLLQVALGALVVLLALLELWQDRNRSLAVR